MNGRQERERQKTQLLRQIQQQRLELSACRRHWHEATAPLDRGWHTLLSLRSWLMVGSGLMAVWSVRHPHFLMRWTKRGLGLWSTWHWCAGSCASRQFANGPERGRFPRAHALPFPCPLLHAVRSNMRLFRSAPFSTTPFTLRHTSPVVAHRVRYSFASAY